MPRFEERGHADDVARARARGEARARSLAPAPFRSAAIPDWRAVGPGDGYRADGPTARVDPDEVWDRLGDFA